MTSDQDSAEGGFIILDALMATALVAIAGAAIVAIDLGIIQQRAAELDRSVALTMAQSLMRQYLLLGPAAGSMKTADELFDYDFTAMSPIEAHLTQAVSVVAHPRRSGASGGECLDFLAPLDNQTPENPG